MRLQPIAESAELSLQLLSLWISMSGLRADIRVKSEEPKQAHLLALRLHKMTPTRLKNPPIYLSSSSRSSLHRSASAVKASPSKLSYVFQCTGCDSYYLQPVGRIVEGKVKVCQWRRVASTAYDIVSCASLRQAEQGLACLPVCTGCESHNLQPVGRIFKGKVKVSQWSQVPLASSGHVHCILSCASEGWSGRPPWVLGYDNCTV